MPVKLPRQDANTEGSFTVKVSPSILVNGMIQTTGVDDMRSDGCDDAKCHLSWPDVAILQPCLGAWAKVDS